MDAQDAGTQVVQQSVATRARAQELAGRAVAAKARAAAVVLTGLELLVAAEQLRDEATGIMAHAVFDIGALTGTHGLTLCGLLAGDEAVLVPDMFWREVNEVHRCKDCITTSAVVLA